MSDKISTAVYFDYRCPYCYRLVRLLTETAELRDDVLKAVRRTAVRVQWRHFSLEQLNAPDPQWKIWEQPLEYDLVEDSPFAMRMLRAFLASYAAARQGKEAFARFRLQMFAAKHDEKKVMSDPEVILEAARRAQLDMEAFERQWNGQEGRDQLREDHLSAEALGVAGLPALVVNDGIPINVKLSDHPPVAEQETFLDELLHLATRRPYLRAFRYVQE